MGRLGQTASPTAQTYFTPGSQVSLQFSISVLAASVFQGLELGAGLGEIQSILAAWSPFSSGAFTNLDCEFDNSAWPSVLTVSFTVGSNGGQYTYGLLAQSIATEINGELPWGSVNPLNLGAGLSTPSVVGAAVSATTLDPGTLLAEDLNLLTGGGLTPQASTPMPAWVWLGLAGVGLLAFAYYS
jgi:hypothetical protein